MLLNLFLFAGCTTQQSILKAPMPRTFDDWCIQEMKDGNQIAVLGEVIRPGVYDLSSAPTLGRAILAAGGFTDYALRRKVKIDSGTTQAEHDLRSYSKLELADTQLHGGDKILVPENMFLARKRPDWLPSRWRKAKEYYEREAHRNPEPYR